MPAKNRSGKERFLISSLSGTATLLRRRLLSGLPFLLAILSAQVAVQAQTAPNLQKEYVYLGGKLLAIESPAGCVDGTAPIAPQPAPLPEDTVWVEDQIPSGASPSGNWGSDRAWTWETSQKVSGTQSHTDLAALGTHQHYFTGAPALYLGPQDKLVAYVLINPCDPPREIMLQWYEPNGSWEHRAYWGANLIGWGTDGTTSRYSMGALPQAGVWVRLEAPTTSVGLAGRNITGMAFSVHDGQAWFDRAGVARQQVPIAPPPSSLPGDFIWVEDQIPAGASASGNWGSDRAWTWDTAQKASGTQSHTDPATLGTHQHHFTGASPALYLGPQDKLVSYVLINPADPPREIMLQWYEPNGSWEHRAYWGENLIASGTDGTPSRYPMGAVPASCQWIRLEVPASAVGLEGKTITGMSFGVYDGQAWFDRAGVGSALLPAQPTSMTFSSSSGFAGIDSFTITVGNGSNMTVEVEYQFMPWGGGDTQTYTGTIGPMTSQGTLQWSLDHSAIPGTYVYTRIRNTQGTDWITLCPQPRYTVRPAKPTSFSISPDSVTLPGSYTVTVGNGQSQTIIEEYVLPDGVTTQQYAFTLNSVGQQSFTTACDTPAGTYTFRRFRNQLDSGDDAWFYFDSMLTFIGGPGCP